MSINAKIIDSCKYLYVEFEKICKKSWHPWYLRYKPNLILVMATIVGDWFIKTLFFLIYNMYGLYLFLLVFWEFVKNRNKWSKIVIFKLNHILTYALTRKNKVIMYAFRYVVVPIHPIDVRWNLWLCKV